jgi:hypothetical protein
MTVIASPGPRLAAEKREGLPGEPWHAVSDPCSPSKHRTFVAAAGALTVTETRSRSVSSLVPKTL